MGTTMLDPLRVSAEDRAAIKAAKDALNEEAAAAAAEGQAAFQNFLRERALDITQQVYLGFEHLNLLDLMSTVHRVGLNERVTRSRVKGLQAFWISEGGYIEASQLRKDVIDIPRYHVGFHVFDNEEALALNFAETQSTLIDLGTTRMDAEVNRLFLRLLQAAVPSGSASYISGAGLDLNALNTAIRQVQDETLDGEVVILGRSTMTQQISDRLMALNGGAGAFTPETNEEIRRTGRVGLYKNAQVLQIKNFRDADDIPFFPGNEMWVIGRDASDFALFGGLRSKDFLEDDNWMWHYLAKRSVGAVIHHPSRVRRIVDLSISPFIVAEQ